jgi:hypothetical protein
MNNLKKDLYLLIGVIVGLLFSKVESINEAIFLLDNLQLLLDFLALLYFLNFTLNLSP